MIVNESQEQQATAIQATDSDDDKYEVIEESDNSLSLMLTDNLNVKTEIPSQQDTCSWKEVLIPAGKRQLICTDYVAGSHLVIEFTLSTEVHVTFFYS